MYQNLRRTNNFSFNEFGFGSKQMESCTSLHKFICFIESIDTAALGGRFDFVGWWIRLRWGMDSTSLGDRGNFVGWKRQFRWLNEALEVAEWSSWCCRMKYLNEAIDVDDFSTKSCVTVITSAVWGHKLWPQTFSAKKRSASSAKSAWLYITQIRFLDRTGRFPSNPCVIRGARTSVYSA